jgi:hypothetical protein
MGIKNLFKNLTSGSGLADADVAALRMPAIAAAAAAYVTAAFVAGPVSKVVLTLTALPVTLVKNGTTSGGGGVQLLAFAEGLVLPVGGSSNLTFTSAAVAGATSYLAAVGSAAADTGGTLTGTEISFLPQTAATTVTTTGAGTCKMKSTVTTPTPGAPLDGTAAAAKAYLNVCLNADATGIETVTLSGTITLLFSDLGDN